MVTTFSATVMLDPMRGSDNVLSPVKIRSEYVQAFGSNSRHVGYSLYVGRVMVIVPVVVSYVPPFTPVKSDKLKI